MFLWVGVFILLARFAIPNDSFFVLDEPKLLTLAQNPGWSGLMGTQGVHYGPIPIWLYSLVGHISFDPVYAILFHGMMISGGICFTALFVKRAFSTSAAKISFALMASSPLLFLYSRQAWDNPMQLFFSALSLVLLQALVSKQTVKLKEELALTTGLAMTLSSLIMIHLMSLSFIAVLGIFLILKKKYRTLSLLALFSILLTLPYGLQVLHEILARPASPPHELPSITQWSAAFFNVSKYFSIEGLTYFSDRPRSWLPTLFQFDSGLLLLLASLFTVQKSQWKTFIQNQWIRLIFTAAIVHAFYLSAMVTELHPHYSVAIAWILPILFGAIAETNLWVKRGVILLIAQNIAFVAYSSFVFAENHGIQGFHLGAFVGAQKEVVRKICQTASQKSMSSATLRIEPQILFLEPFQYHVSTLAECRGLHIQVTRNPPANFTVSFAKPGSDSAELSISQ